MQDQNTDSRADRLRWLAAVAAGLLLRGAYPPFDESELAWFALVPLLVAIRGVGPRCAFSLGLASGLAFWTTSLAWLWRLIDNGGPWLLVVIGHLALSVYCALYTGAFAAIVTDWRRLAVRHVGRSADGAPPAASPPAALGVGVEFGLALAAAAAWAGLEWVRSTLLTGFAWNHLGVSQGENRAVLQLASLGGVYAVSALVLLLNAVTANVATRIWQSARGVRAPRRHWDLAATLALLTAVFFWGTAEIRTIEELQRRGPFLLVAAVQPDAPSIFERATDTTNAMLERLTDRTARVAAFRPDVIVWPETVLPGTLPEDRDVLEFAQETARRANAPLMAGTVERQALPGKRPAIGNAVWMFRADGSVAERYWKQHLVPFGEFIPLARWFPWLERLSPIGFSCTAGTNSVTMRVAMRGGLAGVRDAVSAGEAVLSPLICFESTVAPLARQALRAGATVLINQSNDAWFAGSSQARQHHAQALFRAVENRVPLVRCANAGVSSIIDATGRSGEFADYFAMPLTPRGDDWPRAPYTRFGDWGFAIPCALAVLVYLAARRAARRRRMV